MKYNLSVIIVVVFFVQSQAQKCVDDEECSLRWPLATCTRGRCRCPPNTIRRKSPSREWICLSVVDAATGEAGPPLTCPLPEGAGYQVVLRDDIKKVPMQCSTRKSDCPEGYECIQGLSIFGPLDGVCCPDRGNTCSHPIFDHDDGFLDRWGFDGKDCILFKWNPEKPSSANNFRTKEHCEEYCITED